MHFMPRFASFRASLIALAFLAAFAQPASASPPDDDDSAPVVVGYVAESEPSGEHEAALRWLRENERFTPHRLAPGADVPPAIDVLWIHKPDSVSYANRHSGMSSRARAFYDDGGALLLTNFAAFLPSDMGIESARPEKRVLDIDNNEQNDKKGYQSFRGHPLFGRGLLGGGPIWDATRDYRIPRVGYFGDRFPQEGKVAGVERARTAVRTQSKLLVEYDDGPGRALAAGGYVYLNRPNNVRVKLNRFLENALLYLDGSLPAPSEDAPPSASRTTYWPNAANVPERFAADSEPLETSSQHLMRRLPSTDLLLERNRPDDQFWDLAGRRAIIMGYENGGIDEVWTHPFKLLYDYETGVVMGDSVAWLSDLASPHVKVRPESFTRVYDTPKGELRQIIFPALEGSGGAVHYEAEDNLRLVVRFRTDLKYMWPYPKSALGNVYYGYDEGLDALHVRDSTSTFYCLFGGDQPASETISGQYGAVTWEGGAFETEPTDNNRVYHAAVFDLDAENDRTLNYAFAGSNEGRDAIMRDYRRMLEEPKATYASVVQHYDELLDERVTVDSPNDTYDRFFKWSLVGTDRFFVRTPHLGAGLMAGYATSNPDGGTWASGTPGYAWYFGRDGAWSGFAVNDYGGFDLVKQQIELMQDFQDLRGKIFHALNTAGPGVQQFNAADATPLYVMLAAHYLRASGDEAFIAESWPHLKKAMEFLYSTDTDGDGLIENTNVGHGWIELGELSAAHTTFYLAGLWRQALQDAAYLAEETGHDDLAAKYAGDADDVRETLNTDYWDADRQFFYQAKNKDGSFNDARTMLPAVPMYLNGTDSEKAEPVLSEYASNAFSSDWGIRIIDKFSDLYDPGSYHLGSVWPLFTGWAALAEYEHGRSASGFTHTANNLYVKNDWALGYVEEVLNGEAYESDGVTHHQAWSETMILQPAITGMIGWKPNATEQRVTLQPRFPVHWNSVTVRNLRAGESTVRLTMTRGPSETRYRMQLTGGPPLDVRLAPELPKGQRITAARVGERSVETTAERERGLLADPIRISLNDAATLTLRHTGGVGMEPVVPRPAPGDTSRGYRIVETTLDGNVFRVVLEGRAGSEHVFRLNAFDQAVAGIEGATHAGTTGRGLTRLQVGFEEADRGPFARTTVTVRLGK
jgi:glycogen debranching enzyme